MKKFFFIAAMLCAGLQASAQPGIKADVKPASSLEYFYSAKGVSYNQAIPDPQSFLGYNIGERFVEYGDALRYVMALDRASDRVSFKTFGKTFENRPFIQVYITSPANQAKLEDIRLEHLKLTDPKTAASMDAKKLPIVIDVMGSIHGNEASGINAIVPLMYFYAAAEDPAVKDLLDNAILIFTPGQNPDGLNRFATNVNVYSSYNADILNNSIKEHSLPWPSGRSNHYWMDVNRDWLTAQMPEGQNLVKMYEYWMPNVVLDLHEQGSGSSGEYYFSPGDANRTHYCIPQKNQDLTLEISKYTEHAIDSCGITYFTRRGYDDFFIGKGACYGDVQGSVCILHEQSGTYGHMREFKKRNEIRKFIETVRNQSVASMAVINGAYANRDEIRDYQTEFYINSAKEAAADANKGYSFSTSNKGIAYHFINNLLLHEIDVYPVADKADTWFVPFEQRHYKKLKTIFDDITEYGKGNTRFYDISTWGPVYAYNLKRELLAETPALGEKITVNTFPQGEVEGGQSTVGYAFSLAEYYTPYMLNALQKAGVAVKVAPQGFEYKYKAGKIKKTFPAGTIVIPADGQELAADALYAVISEQAAKCAVTVEALKSDKRKGFTLSDVELRDVRSPKTIIATDMGSQGEIGEDWFVLDHRYDLQHYMMDFKKLNNADFKIEDYNVLVLCGSVPSRKAASIAYGNIAKWVENGGTLILQGNALHAAENIGQPKIINNEGKGVQGLVLKADAKLSSPLLWGYDQQQIPVFKGGAGTYTVPESAETVLSWSTEDPYLTGYVTEENLNRIKGTPVVSVMKFGKGSIVFIAEDLNFRSYWYGTTHIFTNAIYFGDML
ncbi:MAG: hypothetical protein MJY60_01430 [Bacteroidales bacterium]|nr:hypothetical protein [Bacteroidales bacterium]